MKYFYFFIIFGFISCSKEIKQYDPKLFQIFKSYEQELGSRSDLIKRFKAWESNGFNLKADYILGNAVNTLLEETCSIENTLVYLITPHSGNVYTGGMTLKDYNSAIWALQNMKPKKSNFDSETAQKCGEKEILIKTSTKRPKVYSPDTTILGDLENLEEISNKLLASSSNNSFYYCYNKQKLRNTLLSHNLKVIPALSCESVSEGEIGKKFELADPETRLKYPLPFDMHDH